MQFNNYLKRKVSFVAILSLLFGLASCGSYQYVGADDGIYGNTDRQISVETPTQGRTVVEVPNASNSNYYKNYFRTKSLESENIFSDDDIFTDIDSYEGNNYVENDTLTNDYQGYAGWGQNSNSVTININSGWGYNNYWWNRPYYNNWGYGYGWNNWGYYDSFWCPPYYGGGFYGNYWSYNRYYRYPYRNYGYYGNNRYYSGRNVAYNASRRGSYYANSSRSLNGNSHEYIET